jgi:uncharacterized membrane protein YhhN
MRNFERNFIVYYVILAIVEIMAQLYGNTLLIYLTKPALVLSLAVLYLVKTRGEKSALKTLFLTALFFAVCGDIFLMIKGKDLFIAGLASFLVMQWLYTIVFRKQTTAINLRKQYVTLLPFLLYAIIFFLFINPQDPVLRIAIGVYAISIAVMVWSAFVRKNNASRRSYTMVFVGAILFLLSDSLIAIGRFVNHIPMQALWVMSTYALAQLLITLGVIKTNQAETVQPG